MNSRSRAACAALILASAGLSFASGLAASPLAAGAMTARTTPAGTGLVPVASTEPQPQQFDNAEVSNKAIGAWSGKWTSTVYSREGEVLINVETAGDGRLTGTGTSSGGPCARAFTMTGNYQGSLVQMKLDFVDEPGKCAGIQVSVSLTMGHKGNESIAVGHWAVAKGGPDAGKQFGVITLTKDE